MKFKKKAEKVAILLSFSKKTSRVGSPLKGPRLIELHEKIDELGYSKSQRAVHAKHEEKRFDRISGNKEVYFAESLNFVYIDNQPMTIRFSLEKMFGNPVQVRLSLIPIYNIEGKNGKMIEIALYE